jgi:hypothetical protein
LAASLAAVARQPTFARPCLFEVRPRRTPGLSTKRCSVPRRARNTSHSSRTDGAGLPMGIAKKTKLTENAVQHNARTSVQRGTFFAGTLKFTQIQVSSRKSTRVHPSLADSPGTVQSGQPHDRRERATPAPAPPYTAHSDKEGQWCQSCVSGETCVHPINTEVHLKLR